MNKTTLIFGYVFAALCAVIGALMGGDWIAKIMLAALFGGIGLVAGMEFWGERRGKVGPVQWCLGIGLLFLLSVAILSLVR